MRGNFVTLIFSIAVSMPAIVFAQHLADADENLIGLTVPEAMSKLSLQTEKYFVIDEPPAVPRGVFGRTPEGDEITLFIKRGQLPLTFMGGDKLEMYKDIRVIGLKRTKGTLSTCYGEVLWQLACNGLRSIPADAERRH